ncbi:hypothetical protein [Paraburkholderia sp. SIMBA_054]|uniref:hypothetical protein n=1 Tax=Paraburkholderia sp. SIMBA_054 TaxID=3085795 RepID=UPI00397AFF13
MDSLSEHQIRPVTMTQVAREAGLYPAASDLWTRHPDLKKLSNDVSMHLGSVLPGNLGGSLLKDCLVDAIAAFKAAEMGRREDPFKAYVLALVERATDVFDLAVTTVVDTGTIAWDPLHEPLSEFCRRYAESPLSVSKGSRPVPDVVEGESLLLLGVRLLPEYISRDLVRAVVARNTNVTA